MFFGFQIEQIKKEKFQLKLAISKQLFLADNSFQKKRFLTNFLKNFVFGFDLFDTYRNITYTDLFQGDKIFHFMK